MTHPTNSPVLAPELAGRSLAEIRQHYTRLEDYTSPGYMVFTNGKQMLYMGTNVRDEQGALQYAIATLRDVTDLNEARKKVEELQKLTTLYQAQLRTLHTQVLGRDIVYQGEVMRKVLERMLRLARLDGNILLTGETGVGKTLLARYIHVMSHRAHGPFIHVNCASLPESLIEAELFGYSEGAFPSADPDSSRIWWSDSGMHCWHQKVKVEKAHPEDRYGDVVVDTVKSHALYKEWLAKTRPAPGPGGLRRPLWFTRPVRPAPEMFFVRNPRHES